MLSIIEFSYIKKECSVREIIDLFVIITHYSWLDHRFACSCTRCGVTPVASKIEATWHARRKRRRPPSEDTPASGSRASSVPYLSFFFLSLYPPIFSLPHSRLSVSIPLSHVSVSVCAWDCLGARSRSRAWDQRRRRRRGRRRRRRGRRRRSEEKSRGARLSLSLFRSLSFFLCLFSERLGSLSRSVSLSPPGYVFPACVSSSLGGAPRRCRAA